MICKTCNKNIPNFSKYCPYCGSSDLEDVKIEEGIDIISEKIVSDCDINVDNMQYCRHCGKKIENDSVYCKYCGYRLCNDRIFRSHLIAHKCKIITQTCWNSVALYFKNYKTSKNNSTTNIS